MAIWRRALIDIPYKLMDILSVWLRLYLLIVFGLSAIIGPGMALILLVLWYGFGIRWGW